MIARPSEIRRLLRAKGFEGQIGVDAIVALVVALEDVAAALAEGSVRVLGERNGARAVQGLEPLRRLADEHVREAVLRRYHNGNP